MSSIDTRAQLRQQFLTTSAWHAADMQPLSSDASFRRYFRLTAADGKSALLMDSPPDRENLPAYLLVARYLASLGLTAPAIYEVDEASGFAIIEDFGEQTYTQQFNQGADVRALYELAVDVLLALHRKADPLQINCPPYDHDFMLQEVALLTDWYLPALTGEPTGDTVRADYLAAWQRVFTQLPAYRPTLVLRDYHVDNLMIVGDRAGLQQCGLLDFQDAMIGHPAYDLASLLEDARRDIDAALVQHLLGYYERAQTQIEPDFLLWYSVLAAQRHAKVAGIFVRLCVRDGKPVYLQHIPRVMRLLETKLQNPVLAPVKAWFDAHLPDLQAPLPESISQPG